MTAWWTLEAGEAAGQLQTNPVSGLDAGEALRRLEQHGPNRLQEEKGHGPLKLFLAQFKSFIVWVLVGAALVSGFLKEWVDAVAIIGIVVLNAILGFVQEYKAEKALTALRKMASPAAKVIRGGLPVSVPTADLVPGDVVELEAGDHVPADVRLANLTANFRVEEASLTGESTAVTKKAGKLPDEKAVLADRVNMAFMGTSVVSGRGRALVVATGMGTELGRIAGMIQAIESEPTPLQRKLEEFGKFIVKLCFVLVAVVFALEKLRGGAMIDVFLTSVSLAVAAIPEGLPAVVTIALALGVQRMVKRHALIRKLPSVETLGCATVICSDKTGTLTRNEMTVRAAWAAGRIYEVTGTGYAPEGEFRMDGKLVQPATLADIRAAIESGVLCNGARLLKDGGAWRVAGDPTEGCILTCAMKAGIDRDALERENQHVEELPFDSERKRMSVLRRKPGGGYSSHVKGAPDILLDLCVSVASAGGTRSMTAADREEIQLVNARLAGEAMRVLAVARRDWAPPAPQPGADAMENGLTFLGLLAMIDPPREEAREAIRICKQAGIRAVMITGDHLNTASAIGRELGLLEPGAESLSGVQLATMDDAELDRHVERTSVYARVAPEHKLRIVQAWRRRGQIVAMTGDGVNDAPALKEADIGVAMGITGTDVTKEVADMVVTDDNFASIVAAVEEGRGFYANILKFVHYLLSCNAGEILVMLLASIVGMPAPLLPIHILWVNLVTDSLPALALGMEPIHGEVMRQKPRRPDEPVVGRTGGIVMVAEGLFIAFCTLGAFELMRSAWHAPLERCRTAAFVVLSCSQLFHSFNCRSRARSIFSLGLFSNLNLVYATLVSFAILFVAVTMPGLRTILKSVELSPAQWLTLLLLSSFPLWAMEIVKIFLRRKAR